MSKTCAIGEINCIQNFSKQLNEECKLRCISSTDFNLEAETNTNCKLLGTLINIFNDPTQICGLTKPSKCYITLDESPESIFKNQVVNRKKCELEDFAGAIDVTPTIQDCLGISSGIVKSQALSKASIARLSTISGDKIGILAAIDETKYTPSGEARKITKEVIVERSVTVVDEKSGTTSVNERIRASDDKKGSVGKRSGADYKKSGASDERTEAGDETAETAGERTESANERNETADERTESANERNETADERNETADERTEATDEGTGTAVKRGTFIDEERKTIEERTKTITKRSKTFYETTKTIDERTKPFEARHVAVNPRSASVNSRSTEVIVKSDTPKFRRGKSELYNLPIQLCKDSKEKITGPSKLISDVCPGIKSKHSSKLKLHGDANFKTNLKYTSDLEKFIETINLTNSDMVKKSYKLLLKQNLVSEMLSYILASQSICRLSSPINIFLDDISREQNRGFDFSSKSNFHSAGECILEELQLYLSGLKADFQDWESKRIAIQNISKSILNQFELCNSENSTRILMHDISTEICNILQDMNEIKLKRDERNAEFMEILDSIDRYIKFSSFFVRDE